MPLIYSPLASYPLALDIISSLLLINSVQVNYITGICECYIPGMSEVGRAVVCSKKQEVQNLEIIVWAVG